MQILLSSNQTRPGREVKVGSGMKSLATTQVMGRLFSSVVPNSVTIQHAEVEVDLLLLGCSLDAQKAESEEKKSNYAGSGAFLCKASQAVGQDRVDARRVNLRMRFAITKSIIR